MTTVAETRRGSSVPGSPDGATPQPRILLVDDQPARLLTYEAVLEGVGVSCARALSGAAALELLLKEEFAVIVLDVSMPEMDGFEVARYVRMHPRMEKTPIIFVTGVNISELDRLRGYEVGGIDYISVPLVPEIFRSKIALLVELYLRRTELKALNEALAAAHMRLESERDAAVNETVRTRNESAERFRSLLSHPTEHTILIEAVRNRAGGVLHWRCLDANSTALSFLDRTREDFIGKRLEEVLGERAEPVAALSSMVLARRAPHHYETQWQGKRFKNVLFPVGEDTVVATGINIQTGPEVSGIRRGMRAEALLQLAEAFRLLTEPAEIAYSAAQILGRTLGVSRCGYGTIDPEAETITIARDWNAEGIQSIAGVLHFRDYGTYIEELKRGETVICRDASADPRTSATAERLRAIQVQSFVNMPVIEQEGAVALLYLNHDQPRDWPEDELAFIRDAAERTRVAVERRRNEQALAAELQCMQRLRDLAVRLIHIQEQPRELLQEVVTTAMFITGADAGTIQLLDGASGDLLLAATHGFDPPLTASFERVRRGGSTSCGQALQAGQRVYLRLDAAADADGSLQLLRSAGLKSSQSTPLVGRSGRTIGMFSTHWRDVRQLRDRDHRLLDLLGQQAADQIERQQADRHKDEFIAMLSHELRNPLVPIRSGIQILKTAPDPDGVLRRIQPMMERQMSQVLRLVDDLLDVARISSGRLELQKDAVALDTILFSALEPHRDQMQARGLELVAPHQPPAVVLHADGARLTQVLSNLLSNAVKFSDPGGRIVVTANVVRDAPPVWLEVVVRDTGIGIAPEQMPAIFDQFSSLRSSTAERSSRSGLGVGLALARRIAEMHGGQLRAHSDGPGRGSEFVLRIPLEEATAPPAQPHETGSTGALRVLVVDDNRDGADSMVLLLQTLGVEASARYDGSSALSHALDYRPQLVLLDIGMPLMDGYEVCRRLRETHGRALRIVAVTGWGQERDRHRALGAGFDAHLTKPAEEAALAAILREAASPR